MLPRDGAWYVKLSCSQMALSLFLREDVRERCTVEATDAR